MNLTILGSGTCAVTRQRSCSSYYLQAGATKFLLDMGFGALRRMTEAGIDYREIDVILCTHYHLDHIGDLSSFLMATRYTPGFERKKPLTLIGPQGFQSFLFGCRDLFGDWLLPTDEYELNIIELEAEQYRLDNCVIQALPMRHTKQSNGYRFECENKSFVYSGDTGPCDEIVQLADNADVALIECSFPDDQPFEFHLTPQQAGEIAEKAGVKKLVLTHFYPMMDSIDVKSACAQVYNGDIQIAQDLQTFEI